MSGYRNPGCDCDPEAVFELADRALDPGREREIRTHLQKCPGCRELYEREVRLNDRLGSLEFSGLRSCSVCEAVAMALPTRPIKARLVWALVAGGLLLTALFALGTLGTNPAAFVVGAVETFQEAAVMITDVLQTALVATGTLVLAALAVGAALDLLLAAVVLSLVRRRSREV